MEKNVYNDKGNKLDKALKEELNQVRKKGFGKLEVIIDKARGFFEIITTTRRRIK